MMRGVWLAACILFLHMCHSDSASILVFQINPARSHSIVVDPLFEELAARGHHLTVVTSFPRKPSVRNITDIDVSHRLPVVVSNFSFDAISEIMSNFIRAPFSMSKLDAFYCKEILSDPMIQELFHSNNTFDLVMTEVFASDCFVPFAHKFNAPLISYVTSSSLPWISDRVGLPDNPSYIPNYFVDCSPSMTLFQRVRNSLLLLYAKLIYSFHSAPIANSLTTEYLSRDTPPVEEIIRNTSLVFINSHFSFAQSRPFPPNVVEIGGIHIGASSTPLTKDLQDILDKSPQGVILMSFGTLVNVSSIPRHIILKFMNVFSTLSQTVIFKYEGDLPEAPPNVVIRKWLPQRQIIEHQNVQLLLAHGGLASTIEAVHFGKPFIGVPFFGDQFLNVKAIVRKGAGLMLDLNNLSEQKIHHAVTEILNNPSYSENMAKLSRQFHDRPQSPLQSAVFWTEYVIRHQGAPQLRPVSVSLPLHQYLLLDVALILSLPMLLILYLMYFLFFRAVKVSPNDYRNYMSAKKTN